MTYILRKKVLGQLDEIHSYITDNEYETRADKVINSIFETFEKIGNFPFAFPKHSKYENLKSDTRKAVVHRTFIITFRIFKSHVAILDIFHGRRKPI